MLRSHFMMDIWIYGYDPQIPLEEMAVNVAVNDQFMLILPLPSPSLSASSKMRPPSLQQLGPGRAGFLTAWPIGCSNIQWMCLVMSSLVWWIMWHGQGPSFHHVRCKALALWWFQLLWTSVSHWFHCVGSLDHLELVELCASGDESTKMALPRFIFVTQSQSDKSI